MAFRFIVKVPEANVIWDAAASDPSMVLSNSDLTMAFGGPNWNSRKGFADVARSSGKKYFEVDIQYFNFNASQGVGVGGKLGSLTTAIGYSIDEWGYRAAASPSVLFHNSVSVPTFGFTDWRKGGVVICVAVDFTLGYIWFAVDDVQIKPVAAGSGGVSDPAAGTWPCMTGVSGILYPASEMMYTGQAHTLRTKSSDFTYSIPNGFTSWASN